MRPGILFITRNYPPKVGGLEKYSFNLIETFATHTTTHKTTLSKSKKHLLWFLPYSLFKALFIIRKFSVSHVHLCDGLLAPVGLILKRLTRAKVTATIHGLDITYGNLLYQKVIPWCIERLDRIVCVSRSTRDEVLKRTRISPGNCAVIPNGVNPDAMFLPQSKRALNRRFTVLTKLSLSNRKILFTLGHLVRRKGVAWFVAHVMPGLPDEYVYVIAGEGPERRSIEKVIACHHLEKRVFLLGEVTNEIRNILYNLADIFVMPNITVPNDVEGFGIVIIEAGSCGLPVVATNIQGLKDAVIDGKTGFLIQERNVAGFIERIQSMELKKGEVRSIVGEIFGWPEISSQYRDIIFSV